MNANLFDISSKVIIITGAGKGLGKGYAEALAQAGASVICLGRDEQALKATVEKIIAKGYKADFFLVDVSKINSIKKTVTDIFQKYKSIDVLINNAGTEIAEPIEKVSEHDFDTIISVNLKGTYMMTKEVIPYMRNQHLGKIINIGSLGSFIGLANSTVYCASKGGVVQFTKALSLEVAKDNINVNAIAPGYFLTEMTKSFFENEEHNKWICSRIPLGRVGTYKDIVGALIFLSSNASNYITGQTFTIDGGWLAG